MMSQESLSLPCVLHLDSQLVWALPSAHLILLPLETQTLSSQDTQEENQGSGLVPTTLPVSPRAKSSDRLYVLGSQSPPQQSTLTPSTPGLLHTSDLNSSSVTLTSPSQQDQRCHSWMSHPMVTQGCQVGHTCIP